MYINHDKYMQNLSTLTSNLFWINLNKKEDSLEKKNHNCFFIYNSNINRLE